MEEFVKELTELCNKHKVYLWSSTDYDNIFIDKIDHAFKYNLESLYENYNFLTVTVATGAN